MRKSTILLTATCIAALAGAFVWLQQRPAQARPMTGEPNAASSRSARLARVHDRQVALAERLKAAHEIPEDLTDEELRQLMASLSRPIEERTAENELMAINGLMDRLRVSGLVCGEYATALCSLIRGEKTHPVVRDYAMQHAVHWICEARSGHSLSQISDTDRTNLLSCMVSYMQLPNSLQETGYGTALNLIRNLSNPYPEDAAEIFSLCAPRITAVASGAESGPLANRITAIQSLPYLPDRAASLNLVRGMINDFSGDSPVRLVAIATLGSLGEKADLATLRKIQASESNFAYAARAAIDRLESSVAATSR